MKYPWFMPEISDSLITEYNKNPVHFYEMKDFDISFHEWNFICWDDITVYLKIKDNIIHGFSFSWNPWQVSTASCSLLAEMIEWKSIDEVMTRSYQTFVDQWLEVLPRRRRAVVIGLLWVRNAIHQRRKDKKPDSNEIIVEEFEDILED
jgi:NifU-like protein involved in Fe-S cluster formation